MEAIVVRKLGGPDVLALEDVPVPLPAPGQAIVRLVAAGVNFTDTQWRRGAYAPVRLPWTPGIEGSGVVEQVGPGVDPGLIGRRVAVFGPSSETTGTYAEFVAAPASRLIPLPETLGFELAAAFPIQGLTAYHIVHTVGCVRAGQTVLVHAAAGGVGLLSIQMARRAGARVLGVVSSPIKADSVRAAGAEPLLADDDLASAVRDRTGGRGVDLVLDSVGLSTQELSLAVLAPLGQLLYFGAASGNPPAIDPDRLYPLSLRVGAFWLWSPLPTDVTDRASADLVRWVAEGLVRPHISQAYPLSRAADAHRALESRRTVGKLILVKNA